MRRISLLLAATSLVVAPASAATILEQTGIINGGSVLSSGDSPTYDDFRLTDSATIESVSWWSQLAGPTTSTFTISFTTSSGFYPDLNNVIYSRTVTATSHTVGLYTEKFDVDLPVAALLPGNTNLFISIVSAAGGASWGLAGNAPSPGVYGGGNILVTYIHGNPQLGAANAAWSLGGSYGIDNPSAAPEPASWAMLVSGFGLAGMSMRRRRKTLRTSS